MSTVQKNMCPNPFLNLYRYVCIILVSDQLNSVIYSELTRSRSTPLGSTFLYLVLLPRLTVAVVYVQFISRSRD
jgi:hypothetical protein